MSSSDPRLSRGDLGGETLGDFEILREIGRGGMGVVYEALQLSLQRRVALKVLPAHLTLRDETVERFHREASTAARLMHPGIVAIHAVGSERNTHYFAMDLIEGVPLSDWLARQSQDTDGVDANPIERICRIVAQVADALEHAHRAGVVHRDVKPSNILLRKDGMPILTDFGLARAEGSPALTVSGEIAGTPHYVSPEQAMSRRMKLDHRTDVYSLGVTLYELLTQRKPFEGRTSQEVLGKIITKEPAPPRKIDPHIARDLETICLHAMEKDPDKRYPTAAGMAADLRAFLEYRPIAAQPVGAATRAQRWARRNPALAALAALLLLGTPLLAALTGYIIARQPELAAARAQAKRASVERELGNGYFELGEGTPPKAIEAFTRALDIDPKCIEAVAGIALVHVRTEEPSEALTWLDRHASLAVEEPALNWARIAALDTAAKTQEAAALHAKLGEPQSSIESFLAGSVFLRKGEMGDRSGFRRALELMRRAVERAPQARELFHIEWAHAAGHAKDKTEALASSGALRRLWPESSPATFYCAFAIREAKAGDPIPDHRRLIEIEPSRSEAHAGLAAVLLETGDVPGSLAGFRRALELDAENVWARCGFGNALIRSGELQAAIAEFRRAIEIDPKDAKAHNDLGNALVDTGDLEAAVKEYRLAIDADARYDVAYANLGIQLYTVGDFQGAVEASRRAIELDPDMADFHNELGRALVEIGQDQEAIAAYRRAIELDPRHSNAHTNLGIATNKSGDHSAAIALHRKAIEINPKSVAAHVNIAAPLHAIGDTQGAIAALRRAVELAPDNPIAHSNLDYALGATGDLTGQRAELERWTGLNPNDAAAWNEFAWFLVDPEGKPAQHDPAAGLTAARRAVALSKGIDPAILDTLANALYLTGDRPGAIETETKAVELAKGLDTPSPDLVDVLEKNLARFKDGAPPASKPASAPVK